MRPLVALLFSVTLSNQGRRLDLDGRFVFSFKGLFKPLLPNFDQGLTLLSKEFLPDRAQDALGFLAYYFATKKGRFCTELIIEENDFNMEFTSPTNEIVLRPPIINRLRLCVPVRSAKGYRDIRIDPPVIALIPDAQLVVEAFGEPIDEDGSIVGEEKLIPTNEVKFRPADSIDLSDDVSQDKDGVFSVAKIDNEWRVTGLKEGGPKGLLAFVTTRGLGNALLPDKPAFFLPANNAEPMLADEDSAAKVNVKAISGGPKVNDTGSGRRDERAAYVNGRSGEQAQRWQDGNE